MEIVKFYNGQWLLLSYYHLREDKNNNWRNHVWRLGFKGRILLDSGGFSLHKAKLNGKIVPDIKVEDYCDFIKHHGGTNMFCGWFSLDKVDDPQLTDANTDYMMEQGLGEELIPIWNINNSFINLQKLIQKHDPAIIGVGGLLFCERQKRKGRLNNLFQQFPNQLFHGLGVSNEDLFNYDWHSCDGTGVFSPRKYGKLNTYDGQIPLPVGWTVEQGIGYGLEIFISQEENYNHIHYRKLLIPPLGIPEPLQLF
ncbi:hypothetical protein [Paenibacillus periandrae]|uniref:hypothetical protein n=1 Tax=Paenibacillus periandrae TaxID=1761741 RepID=UPI001F09775C|nr:hypothetical protein [Paenibacillus periandrae]